MYNVIGVVVVVCQILVSVASLNVRPVGVGQQRGPHQTSVFSVTILSTGSTKNYSNQTAAKISLRQLQEQCSADVLMINSTAVSVSEFKSSLVKQDKFLQIMKELVAPSLIR